MSDSWRVAILDANVEAEQDANASFPQGKHRSHYSETCLREKAVSLKMSRLAAAKSMSRARAALLTLKITEGPSLVQLIRR